MQRLSGGVGLDAIAKSIPLRRYELRGRGVEGRVLRESEEKYQNLITCRVGRIEDIAQAALYLTAAGSYVKYVLFICLFLFLFCFCLFLFIDIYLLFYFSGHTIVVDGGSWLQSVPFVSENIYAAVSSQRKSKL